MKIDFSQVITAEDKARAVVIDYTVAIKAKCRARILVVASKTDDAVLMLYGGED